MGGKIKLVGALAEAFVRVERDLALLYGVGYWNLEEWVLLDGLIHKGEYVFTNGPGKSLIDADDSLELDSVKTVGKVVGNNMGDLLGLDDWEISSLVNSEAAQISRILSIRSGTMTQMEDVERPGTVSPSVQDSIAAQPLSRCQSTTPSTSVTQMPEKERNTSTTTPIPNNTEAPQIYQEPPPNSPTTHIPRIPIPPTQIPRMPAILSECAPQLSKPFRDGQFLPNIRLQSHKTNRSWSSKQIKILNMEKGDMLEVYQFQTGHKFLARNLRTGESGQIHEEIFFPIHWSTVVGVLERYREKLRKRELKSSHKSSQSIASDSSARDGSQAESSSQGSECRSSRAQTDKRLTCWFWARQGGCSLPDHQCKYAHCDTGTIADDPRERLRKGRETSTGNRVRNESQGTGYGGAHGEYGGRRGFDDSSWNQQPQDEEREVVVW